MYWQSAYNSNWQQNYASQPHPNSQVNYEPYSNGHQPGRPFDHQQFQMQHNLYDDQKRHFQPNNSGAFHPNFNGQRGQNHCRGSRNLRGSSQTFGGNHNMPSAQVGGFRCDPCEKDFTTLVALEAHKKMHVKCDEQGCSFVASGKAVKLHFIQSHAEGKFRICLQTPEEIAKWREERKRNWPTSDNMARKKQKQVECERDGIVVSTKEFVYCEQSGRGRGRGRNRRGGIRERGRGRGGRGRFESKKMSCELLPCDKVNKLKTNSILSEQATVESKDKLPTSSGQGVIASGLSLLQSYDGDDMSDDGEKSQPNKDTSIVQSINEEPTEARCAETEAKNTKIEVEEHPFKVEVNINLNELHKVDTASHSNTQNTLDENSNLVTRIGETELEDGELQSEDEASASNDKLAPRLTHEVLHNQGKRGSNNNGRRRNGRNNNVNDNRSSASRKVPLLEMLLAKEIRHERNVILQCVRYIVNENYFGS